MAVKDYITIGNKDWETARRELDAWLTRLTTRLDAQEGRSGTPSFYSDIDMMSHRITGGPDMSTADSNEFITRAYADATYGDLQGLSGTPNALVKFIDTSVIGDSTIFDTGASVLIGLQLATDAARLRVEIQKNQNESAGLLMQNTASGTLARASIAVRSEIDSNDLTMLVTSALYTTVGGLPASTAMIVSGADTTGGLIIQTGAGDIVFHVGGTTTDFTFNSAGGFTAVVVDVDDDPYAAGWDGSVSVPTKNAVYDQIEAAAAATTAAIAAAVTASLPTAGTYTPVRTIIANCTSVTPSQAFWTQIYDPAASLTVVTVTGSTAVNATVAGTFTSFLLTLPIAAVFPGQNECIGVGAFQFSEAVTIHGAANPVNQATLSFYCVNTGNNNLWYRYSYYF